MKAIINQNCIITIQIDDFVYGELTKAKDWVDAYCKDNGYYIRGCIHLTNALRFELEKLKGEVICFE